MASRGSTAAARTRKTEPSPRLRLVDETSLDEIPGDLDLTRETMSGWKEGQRRCRARKRHNWGPYTVWEHTGFYEVVEQCSHCRNRRTADFSKTGRKLSGWKPQYREGYLLPHGAMRIVEDLHDELVLGDILTRKIVEVADDDD